MATQMIRKQFYIHKRQENLLKRLSKARGVSEAEIVRQAIEREAGGTSSQPNLADRSAWQELLSFLELRRKQIGAGQPYRWNREEIYSEREGRWLRDKDHE